MKKLILFSLLLTVYQIKAQTWSALGSIPSGRHHPVTFSINGIGYAVTGTNRFNQPTDDFFSYDPSTDSWSTLTNFPGKARSFSIGTVVNGKAYIGFGADAVEYMRDLWSYDPATGNWTPLTSCPCAGRRHPAFIGIGDKIYAGLGDGLPGNLKDWWEYDIPTDTWKQITDLPGPERHHPYHFNAGGEVLAGFGHAGNFIYRDWYKLDTATGSWTAVNLFPGEARVAGTQFSYNGFGFVLSGDGDNHSWMQTGEMWRYNPSTDTWLQFPSHPGVSRWAPGSFEISGTVYFFGGLNRQTNQFPNDMWKFDLEAATISTAEYDWSQLNIYPNPTEGVIRISNSQDIQTMTLMNVGGQIIYQGAAKPAHDLSGLNAGVYFLHLS
ncbi:MAG: T9SS type A sorting domain-containing protein, partial [Schleiferiaceae bacterium]|nr:T9SS type A sorting domain-containing protein [Schleiferiaceae bacterium]